MLVLRIPANLQ